MMGLEQQHIICNGTSTPEEGYEKTGKVADKNSQYTVFHTLSILNNYSAKVSYKVGGILIIIENTTQVTLHLKNQLDCTIIKTHVEHLWLAQLDNWDIPKNKKGKPACKVTYAAPVKL